MLLQCYFVLTELVGVSTLLQLQVWMTKLMSSTSKEFGDGQVLSILVCLTLLTQLGWKTLSSPLLPSLPVSIGIRKLPATQFVLSVFGWRPLHFPFDSKYLATANVYLFF